MKSTTRLCTSTIVAALGGLLFGFETAVISGATAALQEYFDLSEAMLGFTVVTALIGTVLGSIAVSRPADIWGRKRVLIVLAILYTVSAIGSGLAWDLYSFWIFRLIGGLAVGGASVVSPMYIAEISPAEKRGRLVGWQQFNVCFGICLAYISNYFVAASGLFAESIHSPMAEWRWMFLMEAIPSLAFFFFHFRIPFSPRWLVEQKRMDDALAVLQSLGAANPKAVLDEIIESMHEKFDVVHARFWTPKLWLPITAAIALAVFNQLSGINALLYFAPKVFTMGGSEGDLALLQSIPIGIMLVIGTAIGLASIAKLGRKRLLIAGSLGMAAFLADSGLALWRVMDLGNRDAILLLEEQFSMNLAKRIGAFSNRRRRT
jgi:sugar porter (SP) family MFS transporter